MKPRGRLPWAMGTAATLFYLCFHSHFYNFDGVACAIAVDLSDFRHLVHGNHLAYGVLGWGFHGLWRLLGYAGPAIMPLQTLDSLLGGASSGVFCAVLLRLGIPARTAGFASAGLALSQAWWMWSLEAQVYMLGAFFLLLAAWEAVGERPRGARLGLWHGLAVLGHVGNLMFAPAAAYWLWRARRSGRDLRSYAATAGAVVLAAYGLAALLVVRPGSVEEWRVWLLGSAALKLDKSFVWYGGYSWTGFWEWARMTLRVFADPVPLSGEARLWGWLISGAALCAAAAGAAVSFKPSPPMNGLRSAVRGALLWLFSFAVLYASWQPSTVVYRMTDLVPLWILIVAGLQVVPREGQAGLLCAWALAAGLFNWKTMVSVHDDPESNKAYQEAIWLGRGTPENSWVVVTGRGQVYVPYFAHRKPVNMRYYEGDLAGLAARLDALAAAGEPVFITGDTLSAGSWTGFFESYGLKAAGRGRDMILFRVKRKGSPAAGGKRGSRSPRRSRKGRKVSDRTV